MTICRPLNSNSERGIASVKCECRTRLAAGETVIRGDGFLGMPLCSVRVVDTAN
jgi:hypothetical protein